jgi:hypothetical protein
LNQRLYGSAFIAGPLLFATELQHCRSPVRWCSRFVRHFRLIDVLLAPLSLPAWRLPLQ